MDKLDTNLLGGFPFDLDDLDWLQTCLAEPIRGLCEAFGQKFILSGCNVTGGGGIYDISPGWVVLNSEPCYWAGGTGVGLPGGVELYSLALETSLDPAGLETFQDLSVQNAYQRRRAVPILTALAAAGSIPHVPITGDRLGDRVRALLGDTALGAWRTVGATGEPSFQNGWVSGSGVSAVMYRKESGGLVRLKGVLYGGSSSGSTAFQLPAGYRPAASAVTLGSRLTKFPAPWPTTAERLATVNSAGDFSVWIDAPSGNDVFNLAEFPAFYAEG